MDAVAGVTRMWEARAAPGRVDELVGWLGQALAGTAAEIYRGVGDNSDVVVVLFHPFGTGPSAAPVEAGGATRRDHASVVANIPPGLLARSGQAWDFERVSSPGPDISDRWGDR
ncbi:hypothetical protein BL254_08405 [Protofrankia sp. BMG5.30]|uniref:Uncharacterized protein n=1 Tax=Protofrankia coriariae TaxID=1562887 RepID=A0ABR5F7I7_9ACTN|nr:hypothetical protein FrCorBMG51_03150 [Protofrankia coriariae]ONH36166.1 hypothetical protein BL254_08405 [Protofrankia sp. BMG5.30]